MSAPRLQLKEVTKSFGAVRALRGVSFDLQAGEVHALVGENGAGKSTLIKIITGAHRPDSGAVEIGGQVIEGLSPRAAHALGIAVIYQQPALFPDLTVAENIALTLEPPGGFRLVRWKDRRARAVELLNRVGARVNPEAEARDLSMPEQQLVEIARALGAGAKVLILDEPTASLTTREVELLLGLVRNLRDEGVGIIYISHRLEEIFRVADRVTILRDGQSVGTREVGGGARPPASPQLRSEGGSSGAATNPLSRVPANPVTLEHPNLAAPEDRRTPPPETEALQPLSESELIRMMVGREISSIFPPAEGTVGEVVLSIRGVSCEASGLREIDLEVRAGEIVGLSGLVGAGRTELARVLFGITPSEAGTIRIAGSPVRIELPSDAIRAGIAYVPEDRRKHGVILEMALAANVTLAIQKSIFPRGWLRFDSERELAGNFIRDLSIKALSSDDPVATLSGGNQQKVALARWLAAKPRVLILDEPTQGVDVGAKAEIHKLIRDLAARGLAVLMISSELAEIMGMSDRIVVMRRGRIAATLDARTTDAHSVMAASI